ncbi:hypothetical protein GCM10017771_06760 [Streptomyces capitiformicae]|uniref:Uncharacterized protein n=2 Tax=Streptomyces capitiformicae TaxID=2014920 RepID=A0A919GEI5_9ACTN|nr:hypothetical protein GCM10017771_06760 [Streptomyces capitiformicae]
MRAARNNGESTSDQQQFTLVSAVGPPQSQPLRDGDADRPLNPVRTMESPPESRTPQFHSPSADEHPQLLREDTCDPRPHIAQHPAYQDLVIKARRLLDAAIPHADYT